jgi:hypothetical protein
LPNDGLAERAIYVLEGVHAFHDYRQTTATELSRLSARLEDEAGFIAPPPAPRGTVTSVLRWIQRNCGNISKFFQHLSDYLVQSRSLRTATHRAVPSHDAIVAVASPRLASGLFELGPRHYLAGIARELGGSSRAGSPQRDIETAARVFVCDPVLFSAFWVGRRSTADQLFVIDRGYLLFLTLTAPWQVVGALWQATKARAVRQQLRRTNGRIIRVLTALVLDHLYCHLFGRIPATRGIFFTSNSFATEILRMHLLAAPLCQRLCEIQHGVPPIWEETYVARLIALASKRCSRMTTGQHPGRATEHHFIAQVSGLPGHGIFRAAGRATRGAGINAYLNKYLLEHHSDTEPFLAFLERQWNICLPGLSKTSDVLIASVTGTTCWTGDARSTAMESGNFAVERHVIRTLRKHLATTGRSFTIIYTPHPLLDVDEVRSHRFFIDEEIIVHDGTPFTWFIADLCVSLYSSTLFEASFLGVDAFTPITLADRIYEPQLLATVDHPAPGETIDAAIQRFVRRHHAPTTTNVMVRAAERLARVAPELLTAEASSLAIL